MRKKTRLWPCLALLPGIGLAADYPYNVPSGFVGKLTEKSGIDCCTFGKEKQVKFPAIVLQQPINLVADDKGEGVDEDTPEQGVRVMQLVLGSPALWKAFKAHKGKQARVMCSLFHSHTGHHLTPVLCEVSRISKPDEP